jgi:hypothetical protein
MEFVNLPAQARKPRGAFRREDIVAASLWGPLVVGRGDQAEPALFGKSVQKGVQGARTDVESMSAEFLENPLPVNGLLLRVMQDVDLPEGKKHLTQQLIGHPAQASGHENAHARTPMWLRVDVVSGRPYTRPSFTVIVSLP